MLNFLLLSLALSIDGFMISFGFAMQKRDAPFLTYFFIAGCFAFFQFIMPIIGWILGSMIQNFIEIYTDWIAFFLLIFIGLSMIFGSFEWKDLFNSFQFSAKKNILCTKRNRAEKGSLPPLSFFLPPLTSSANSTEIQRLSKLSLPSLFLLGFVTSLDALTVGVSYGILQKGILLPACIISFVTFFVTFLGAYCSLFLSKNTFIAKFSTIIGGFIIIGVAINGLFR